MLAIGSWKHVPWQGSHLSAATRPGVPITSQSIPGILAVTPQICSFYGTIVVDAPCVPHLGCTVVLLGAYGSDIPYVFVLAQHSFHVSIPHDSVFDTWITEEDDQMLHLRYVSAPLEGRMYS
ncbi:hypothetical protein V8B97DRAFT_520729 [Scleroderma yunnanense]